MTNKSMWGDLENLQPVRTPNTCLKEQADALTQGTKGLLIGIVDITNDKNQILIDLDIKAPRLNGYVYSVLRVYQPIHMYPLRVLNIARSEMCECSNEEEFVAALEKILSSEEVSRIVLSLISQSK